MARKKHLPYFLKLEEKGFHIWGGYYNVSPSNDDSSFIAYLKVPVRGGRSNEAIIEVYNTITGVQRKIDVTKAWNWQQGTMLQWCGNNHTELIYNICDKEGQEYRAKMINIESGECRLFEKPVYALGGSGNRYLSLNFKRLGKYVPDYGYSVFPLVESDESDGIWEVDMQTMQNKLVLSIKEVVEFCFKDEFYNSNHYLNHVSYSPSENEIVFIHRWSYLSHYKSRLLLWDKRIKKMSLLLDNEIVSHYCWRANNILFIYAKLANGNTGYFDINIHNGYCSDIPPYMPSVDGHPTIVDLRKKIITDTYPDTKRMQHLYMIDELLKETIEIGSFYSPFKYYDGERCDLHPKLSMDNRFVFVDSTSSGNRGLYMLKILELL